ncbi:MAG: nucleotidyl transferase AbiEii/AbiGii toxin family protein [Phycisphaerae bacterium]
MKKIKLSVPASKRPVDPLEIFSKLTLRGSIENIWDPQAEALREWHKNRNQQDVALEMTAETIRDEQEYNGIRLKLAARLGTAVIPVQIDIGFGDAITPDAQWSEYPTLLKMPRPELRTYPKETVLAEKLQIMTSLGIGNSRMKDFFDLWVMTQDFSFEGELIAAAIQATFERRGTPVPKSCPMALGPEFAEDVSKQAQWRAFLNRGRLRRECPDFAEITKALAAFFGPVLMAIEGGNFEAQWSPGGPWRAE